ncbi:MAG: sigma-70 family RNA polymerase sigma factor [Solirubrobacteraceae bacterium]|nr:sigma-70 family RNA polymerase sigma factor [Patulibacter sp.]
MSETLSATMATARPPRLEFDALYRTACGDVYAYVASLVGDAATAEDVTAIAFERAYRKRRSFDPRRGSPRQWLFTIARNASLDELRRRKRSATPIADAGERGSIVLAGGSAVAAGGARATADGHDDPAADRADQVRTAIASLSPRDRDLIALKFYAGLSNAEIATTLGISESNAGTRVHRALSALREACS